MKNTNFAFAMYKPTDKNNAVRLKEILEEHIPTLRKYELITDSPAYMLQSEDGTIIESFEWRDEEAKQAAHAHPAIRSIWGQMEGICNFPSLKELPESDQRFPNFEVIVKR